VLTFLGLLAVAALIAANGYFVAAEFSWVAARRGRLEDAAATGDRKAARAVTVHKRLSFMLSGAQLGITVTSLLVGYIAEPTLGRALQPVMGLVGVPEGARFGVALTVGFILATATQMVIGELAPKNLAIAKPEPVARALASSILGLLRVASPLIRLFDGSANRLLRAVGIEPVDELHGAVSVEELDLIVEESVEHGKLPAHQAALLERAIDFGTLHASGAMVPWNRVVTIAATSTCEDLRALMATAHSRFPVLNEAGDVTGVVHAKDLFAVDDTGLATTTVDHLGHPPLVVPETATLRTVLGSLRREATEMAVVANEYGAPAGVVTLEDLLEELVGDIADEYDPAEPDAERTPDGTWRVPGSWRIDEIERATGVELPLDGAYDTVAGLVLARLERLAEVGDRVRVADHHLEVLATDGWTVTEVGITPPPEPVDEDHPSDGNRTGSKRAPTPPGGGQGTGDEPSRTPPGDGKDPGGHEYPGAGSEPFGDPEVPETPEVAETSEASGGSER
jgi:CBS domain containing-hemolysin-like protein